MTLKNKIVFFLALAVAIVAGVALVYLSQQFPTYQLDISNESDAKIHQVSVFGMGVNKPIKIVDVEANQLASIVVYLKERGDLRFSVQWGSNKLDQLIIRDVSMLKNTQQWLTVYPSNRFIINNVDIKE